MMKPWDHITIKGMQMITFLSTTSYYFYVYRCAVGDLSGKNGQVDIRAQGSVMRTQVATDSNLPLVGPYTGNPFYLVTSIVLILYLTTLVLKYYC